MDPCSSTRNVTSNDEPVTTPSEEKVGLGRSAHSPAAVPASRRNDQQREQHALERPGGTLASCSNS